MPASPPKLARWPFLLCLTCGLISGGAISYSNRSPAISKTPRPESSRPAQTQSPHELSLLRSEKILEHPATADKQELLEIVNALAFAKEDRISPILDDLIDIFGNDSSLRNIIFGWAWEHPDAAIKFALESERPNHPVVSTARSVALTQPDGATFFIDHVRGTEEPESIPWPDLARALATAERAGVDSVEAINSLPESLRPRQFSKLLENRTLTDPKKAFNLAISDPVFAEASKAAAFELLEGLFEQNPDAATTFLDQVPDAARTEFASAAVYSLVSTGNSAAAFDLADQLLTSENSNADPTTVLQYLTNGHINSGVGTRQLVDWLQALPTDELRAEGEKVFINIVIRKDPGTVIPWLQESEPGATRDQHVARLLYDLPNDHESFDSMLQLIGDPKIRSSTEKAIASRPRFDLPSTESDAN